MPFGVKNAKVEFQQMVNKIFGEQINRNIEVYVDDLIIKFEKLIDLPIDILETSQKTQIGGIKLSPKKCIFGVPSGKCLAYIIL